MHSGGENTTKLTMYSVHYLYSQLSEYTVFTVDSCEYTIFTVDSCEYTISLVDSVSIHYLYSQLMHAYFNGVKYTVKSVLTEST